MPMIQSNRSSLEAHATIVSGLPRSGTSMLMQMLAAGGMEPLTDGVRKADPNNPLGYLEYEAVKGLPGETSWLPAARGKAVKIVVPLLQRLPAGFPCRVVLLERDMNEVLTSQDRMLTRLGKERNRADDPVLAGVFRAMLVEAERWIHANDIPCLKIYYVEAVADPEAAARHLNLFLGGRLMEEPMARAVRPDLRREKAL